MAPGAKCIQACLAPAVETNDGVVDGAVDERWSHPVGIGEYGCNLDPDLGDVGSGQAAT